MTSWRSWYATHRCALGKCSRRRGSLLPGKLTRRASYLGAQVGRSRHGWTARHCRRLGSLHARRVHVTLRHTTAIVLGWLADTQSSSWRSHRWRHVRGRCRTRWTRRASRRTTRWRWRHGRRRCHRRRLVRERRCDRCTCRCRRRALGWWRRQGRSRHIVPSPFLAPELRRWRQRRRGDCSYRRLRNQARCHGSRRRRTNDRWRRRLHGLRHGLGCIGCCLGNRWWCGDRMDRWSVW